ncbi:dynein assembly factor 4, axonemal [Astyanax mexicanus]|uniref:Dynein axonemal assembly factor 4 n=1 Tax=Astyanax mexicanus TaxID=7994 RepID=A0A8T2LPR5_ASTMX|nr:dynein assembly factor 4, axonemal [Astyanax mexicanus]
MPLLVTDYSWTQTESTVYISVPLKGVKPARVDVLCTDEYLKVSFPPFLCELFLSQPVEEEKSVAKLRNGAAVFTLPKQTAGLWEKLSRDVDKSKQREIREEAILKTQNKAVETTKARATKIQQDKKYTLETMMKLEEEERARIQKIKDEECAKASMELEAWKKNQRRLAEEEEARRRLQEPPVQKSRPVHQQREPEKACVMRASNNPSKTEGQTTSRNMQKQKDLPPPRSAGCIKISFTPRVFSTALRESRVPEEEEWLRKQAEVRRMANADLAQLDDLKEEEKNPDWLKDKGDKLFRTGNYQAAVNAYDLAIKLNRRIPALFSNRAACHLKLRNLHKAIEDSSQALELLTPAVTDNAAARLKAHVRRGTAFCELELYVEGLQDYHAALKIDPNNQALRADADKIREIIQGTMSSS